MEFIKFFDQYNSKDFAKLGGKNASLGKMITKLWNKNINIPLGFAITVDGYWEYIKHNKLQATLKKYSDLFNNIYTNESNFQKLKNNSEELRQIINSGEIPLEIQNDIIQAYKKLSNYYKTENLAVAIRSSATAEDSPKASFAGQQESFLNIRGDKKILETYKQCLSSLFTTRAITYRIEQGFDHLSIGISVGIQKMVRSDKAAAGVIFTLDTETGFKDVIVINSSYGLGETVVQGSVNPDEYHVHKITLEQGYAPIIKKKIGSKEIKLIYSNLSKTDLDKKPTKLIKVSKNNQKIFSLTDDEILNLARQAIIIENFYTDEAGHWVPMDIEWAKDGLDNKLYIVQARPETVHSQIQKNLHIEQYNFNDIPAKENIILHGLSIGTSITFGKAKVIKNLKDAGSLKKGEILVTTMTDPNWVPLMKQASAIITDQGGRSSHAAIVSRELKIPALVGTINATELIESGSPITVDCSYGSTGTVYKGIYSFQKKVVEIKNLGKAPVPILLNIADPETAYKNSELPVVGVGLTRLEFVISNSIQIHPMAIIYQDSIPKRIQKQIIDKSFAYNANPKKYYVSSLSQAIGTIAAAFYPRRVLIRLTDFKSNEYRSLIGGKYFEPKEENPMLGFRGAARYINQKFRPAFELECQALKEVRETMGFTNVDIMIPFVRTVSELIEVLKILSNYNLKRSKELKIYIMSEVPSNIILLSNFAKLIDGFSIGSNDLSQLILGVDRDSALLSKTYNEEDLAVQIAIRENIRLALAANKKITICGQAPGEFDQLAKMLIKEKIDGISLDSNFVIPFLLKHGLKSN